MFESRRTARAGQKAQLGERIAQLREEIGGLAAQREAKAKELDLINTELAGQQELWAKNLITISSTRQYSARQRDSTANARC